MVTLYIQQDVTLHSSCTSENCSTCFGYLSHRYCYLPLSWRSWNWFECAVGGVRHPQQIPDAVDTVVCAPDDGWRYHPKHVEQFPGINKLCKVTSCWIYIGIESCIVSSYRVCVCQSVRFASSLNNSEGNKVIFVKDDTELTQMESIPAPDFTIYVW